MTGELLFVLYYGLVPLVLSILAYCWIVRSYSRD